MANKPALGKGLASLLSNAPANQKAAETASAAKEAMQNSQSSTGAVSDGEQIPVEMSNRDRHPGISIAKIEEIKVNPFQPRREFDENALTELCHSIESNGIIQPLVVRKTEDGFELIAGERRLRAAKKAGLNHVPVVIRKSTDRESLELALIENIQRSDLNCIDEALGYFHLIQDFNLKQEDVAKQVGKDRATVANHLRLLKLPESIIEDLKSGTLTLGHGKAISSLEKSEFQLKLRKEILERKLSVRETEARAAAMKKSLHEGETDGKNRENGAPESRSEVSRRLEKLSQELTRTWSMKVAIKGSERKGKIVIRYGSREDLEKALDGLQRSDLWQN